jgi:hypothetical protein
LVGKLFPFDPLRSLDKALVDDVDVRVGDGEGGLLFLLQVLQNGGGVRQASDVSGHELDVVRADEDGVVRVHRPAHVPDAIVGAETRPGEVAAVWRDVL